MGDVIKLFPEAPYEQLKQLFVSEEAFVEVLEEAVTEYEDAIDVILEQIKHSIIIKVKLRAEMKKLENNN